MSAQSTAMRGASPDPAFWRRRSARVTGHSGFMGGWLVTWLHRLGAHVAGLSLPAPTTPSFYEAEVGRLLSHETVGDIRDPQVVARAVQASAPKIVFHLAAQPLVREAFASPVDTFHAVHKSLKKGGAPSFRVTMAVATRRLVVCVSPASGCGVP
jgi:CDP-glucose 4,6-dehydratase